MTHGTVMLVRDAMQCRLNLMSLHGIVAWWMACRAPRFCLFPVIDRSPRNAQLSIARNRVLSSGRTRCDAQQSINDSFSTMLSAAHRGKSPIKVHLYELESVTDTHNV